MAANPFRLLKRLVPPRRVHKAEADYVVVGAGSAGCVLTNRLSANGANTVHLLEAGPWDSNLMVHIPAGVYAVCKDPSVGWNYMSEPEPGCFNRQIELPRGKVVGGSSAVNAMVYMRGHPKDYDSWASDFGLPEWRFENVLPYFKRCESSDRGPNEFRGGSGPLGVTKGTMENALFDACWEAGKTSGQGTSDDLNGYKPEGIARMDRTSKDGYRCSAAHAFLAPALERANVSMATGVLCDEVMIEGGRAVGVRYTDSATGEIREVRATKEVILSAGSINTPQLLMLSGIGPAAELKRHGIECKLDLGGVGRNLQDHLCVQTAYHCTDGSATLHNLANPIKKVAVGAEWLLTRGGICASNIWEMGGLVYSRHKNDGGFDQPTHPNMQYHFSPVHSEFDPKTKDISLVQGYHMQIDQLRPKSRGAVTLRSKDPRAAPAAQFNYLSDPEGFDLRELVGGYRAAHELLEQPAFDGYKGTRVEPHADIDVNDDKAVEDFVRGFSTTDYHPCGTARMGSGEGQDEAPGDDGAWVVDGQMRVRGMEGLRVVDASVMPAVLSGNLNAGVQMIAERASDYILGVEQLAPERPQFHFDIKGPEEEAGGG